MVAYTTSCASTMKLRLLLFTRSLVLCGPSLVSAASPPPSTPPRDQKNPVQIGGIPTLRPKWIGEARRVYRSRSALSAVNVGFLRVARDSPGTAGSGVPNDRVQFIVAHHASAVPASIIRHVVTVSS